LKNEYLSKVENTLGRKKINSKDKKKNKRIPFEQKRRDQA